MTTRIRTQRRRFLRNFALGGAVVSGGSMLPLRALAHSMAAEDFPNGELVAYRHKVSFEHGVASGDLQARKVIIWTRVSSERGGVVPVRREVAHDANFRRVVRAGVALTGEQRDFTVKVDVSGLRPDNVRQPKGARLSGGLAITVSFEPSHALGALTAAPHCGESTPRFRSQSLFRSIDHFHGRSNERALPAFPDYANN